MTIYKKTFAAKPSADGKTPGTKSAAASMAPITSQDNKRTFDARPKPSDDNRREERVRPTQHIDRIVDPLEAADSDEE